MEIEEVIRDIITRVEQLESTELKSVAQFGVDQIDSLGSRKREGSTQRSSQEGARKRRRYVERELERLKFEKPVAYQTQSDDCTNCVTCDVSFCSPTQLSTHLTLFHLNTSSDNARVEYRCNSCNSSFDALADLLLHADCFDERKLRLGAGDMAVCLLCGWAVGRARLFDHLKAEHLTELSKLLPQQIPFKCRFCSPTVLLKTALDVVFHTAIFHFVSVVVLLRPIEPPLLCQICNQLVPAHEFRLHVLSVHISAAKKNPLPTPNSLRHAKAKKSFVQRKTTDLLKKSKENVVSTVMAEEGTSEPGKSNSGFICSGCQKAHNSGAALAMHKVLHECQPTSRIGCPFCTRSLINRQLWTHVTVSHDDRMRRVGVDARASRVCGIGKEHRGRGPVACVFCPLQFQHVDTQRLHIALLHPNKKSPLSKNDQQRRLGDSSTRYPAPSSAKRFVIPAVLPSPKPSHPNIRCLSCGAKFYTDFSLNAHRRIFHDAVSEQDQVLQRMLLVANDTMSTRFRLNDNVFIDSMKQNTPVEFLTKTYVANRRRQLQVTLRDQKEIPYILIE